MKFIRETVLKKIFDAYFFFFIGRRSYRRGGIAPQKQGLGAYFLEYLEIRENYTQIFLFLATPSFLREESFRVKLTMKS